MDDAARERWRQVRDDYRSARKIALEVWGEGAPAEVVQAATAALLAHYEQHGGSIGNGSAASGAGAPSPALAVEVPPCPKCGGVMQIVEKKHARMPDFRCRDRECDTPLWRDRKKAGRA